MARGQSRRIGWVAILAGVALALAVQVAAPVAVPLYDGIVVQEPYRFLHPTGNQPGDPTSFSASPAIDGAVSRAFAAATTENPPQAQVIAQLDAFVLPPGATSIQVSVTPVDPPAVDPGGPIAGNVYRFAVTDQSGNSLATKPCNGCRSLVLRAPEGVTGGVIRRFANGTWTDVETFHAGVVAMYQTNPTVLGDFAVISTGTVIEPGVDVTLVVLGGGIVVVFLGILGLLVVRRPPSAAVPSRPRGVHPTYRPGAPSRVPSKRRGSRRPPSGRSGP